MYLALFEDLFDFKQSKFLTENDKVYKNQKHIQFNEYIKVIKESVELYE